MGFGQVDLNISVQCDCGCEEDVVRLVVYGFIGHCETLCDVSCDSHACGVHVM